ncbi:lysylphosphatidylglycerol synthase transmembrane domain-containing protein [Methanoculleus sp. 7T]|uniref:lysylphosphatidylglycerol synthase transmembrane domain-containing protein n=1 Tax=Methanoculleus sp. 7T TaxID=2937282 RepID=UPI0020C06E4D|nr:flippase-like domain-containing protein [Methanoculleus sp. 7T]MCK8519239.1 flippase-like domain-containing protein [Methanoculleus sp. 7T]
MEKSQWKWLLVSVGFSTLVMAGVLYFTVDEMTVEYLSRVNPFYLVLAVLLHILSLGFWALRIQKMSGSLGYRVGFRHCLNLVLANMLVAAVTPSQAGGEPVRIHELYRAGVTVGDATAVVIMERVIDGIVLGAAGAFAMLFLGRYWSSLTSGFSGVSLVMYAAWVSVTIFVLIFVYSVKNPDYLKRVLRWISCWVDRRWHLKRLPQLLGTIDREADNFNRGLAQFVNHGKSGLVWGFIFTALFWFSEFVIASMLLLGLGQSPYFIESFVVQLVIAIIMMIPLTPGGSGIAELAATSFYSLFVPSSIVGVFVLLWRLILYYLNIFLGLLPSLSIVRREFLARAKKQR